MVINVSKIMIICFNLYSFPLQYTIGLYQLTWSRLFWNHFQTWYRTMGFWIDKNRDNQSHTWQRRLRLWFWIVHGRSWILQSIENYNNKCLYNNEWFYGKCVYKLYHTVLFDAEHGISVGPIIGNIAFNIALWLGCPRN